VLLLRAELLLLLQHELLLLLKLLVLLKLLLGLNCGRIYNAETLAFAG
jgi:hypothetical protein